MLQAGKSAAVTVYAAMAGHVELRLLYTAIDLGALQQRLSAGHERLLYVVDVSQEFHFKQIFAVSPLEREQKRTAWAH